MVIDFPFLRLNQYFDIAKFVYRFESLRNKRNRKKVVIDGKYLMHEEHLD